MKLLIEARNEEARAFGPAKVLIGVVVIKVCVLVALAMLLLYFIHPINMNITRNEYMLLFVGVPGGLGLVFAVFVALQLRRINIANKAFIKKTEEGGKKK